VFRGLDDALADLRTGVRPPAMDRRAPQDLHRQFGRARSEVVSSSEATDSSGPMTDAARYHARRSGWSTSPVDRSSHCASSAITRTGAGEPKLRL
jgi:hypothetical protein